ncbi:MAG: acetolactate synthase small subunit [Candidatus Aureabacteria bacterium]|nr:acetolactate synthase small subunit [Candidatus Auribacterota bacterium]
MKHTISALVENKSGVLAKIAGLFSARGFNIDSLAVGETQDPTISRMTIVVRGDDAVLEQVCKQLNKLVDVIKVQDFAGKDFVDRELILLKVSTDGKTRHEVLQIVEIFRAKIIDIKAKSMTIEATGSDSKVNAIIDMLRPFGIKELARTGKIAIARG